MVRQGEPHQVGRMLGEGVRLRPQGLDAQSASRSARAPADGAAGVACGGSGHADTTNSCSTRAASDGGFRGDAVQLWKGRERNGLRG